MWEEVGKEEGIQFDTQVVYDGQADRERRAKEQAGAKKKFFTGATERRLYFYDHYSLGLGATLPHRQHKLIVILTYRSVRMIA